ncbi:MAG TPA: tRNA 2-selenouridine(34) synthase MnmH [Casimicrobiaceae bacterium]
MSAASIAPLPPGPPPRPEAKVPVEAIAGYADRIDVRSPGEFALDHLPGAINLPILDDAERARVGTLYVQVSAFEARKLGAALVARNIARIVENEVRDRPPEWSPLVYCWRGGQRSRALVHVLREIGFRAVQLDGGYRAWRRHVTATLVTLPLRFRYRVVCGLTGSGKSRLIEALAAEGAQVLDLEALARHRGSLLGDIPGAPQPTQKAFESALVDVLGRFDAARPVFVESESRRIGRLQTPAALLAAMRGSECIRLETPTALRVAMLTDDYAHLVAGREQLRTLLARIAALHGKETAARWGAMAEEGDVAMLVRELLDQHYDPLYERAIERNFACYRDARVAAVTDASAAGFRSLARGVLEDEAQRAEPLRVAG